MSDSLCVGVCMIDWDSGVCLGCGRTSEEIEGVPIPVPPKSLEDGKPDWSPPLPKNVADQVGEGTE